MQHYRQPPGGRIERTLRELAACRTPALGGHLSSCAACGLMNYHYHSCGNRHCPQCGGNKRAAWFAKQAANVLPVPYFHVVFTLPHQLSALILGNRVLLYNLLFQAASAALLQLAADPKHLGANIGMLMVLHTWGQQLEHHPHLHAIVPGGGLSDDASGWIACRSATWLVPRVALGKLFRGKYLAGLRQAYRDGQLHFDGSTAALAEVENFNVLIRQLYQMNWMVYAKRPFGGSPEQVLKYLARYTHRVAISNSRLQSLENGRVLFTWKDYKHDCQHRQMTLEATEFIRRFTLHILPRGFVRIRHYGLLANRDRSERLATCRKLLSVPGTPAPAPATPATSCDAPQAAEPRASDEAPCPACGAKAIHTLWQKNRPSGTHLESQWGWDTS